VANRVEGLREVEGYDNDISVGLEQTSDGMKKEVITADVEPVRWKAN